MAYRIYPPLRPRAGTLRVLAVLRHSDGPDQTDLSHEAQDRQNTETVEANYCGPCTIERIVSRGSGEWLDRAELDEIHRRVATRAYDVLLADEGSRIIRDYSLLAVGRHCVANGTRLIAPGDYLDTAQEDWEERAVAIGGRAARENESTSRRIKTRMDERFLKYGMIGAPVWWLEKPDGAGGDGDCRWGEGTLAVRLGAVRRLRETLNWSAVADWLNSPGVDPWLADPTRAVGGHRHSRRWTGGTLKEWFSNPVHGGRRYRGRFRTQKNPIDGRRRSKKNDVGPDGTKGSVKHPERWRDVPHLKWIDPDEQQALLDLLAAKNAGYVRKGCGAGDTRRGTPRKRTVWPGQAVTCGVCGRAYHYGANGNQGSLGCAGYQGYRCWNPSLADGPSARAKLLAAVAEAVDALPDEWPAGVRAELAAVAADLHGGRADEERRLVAELRAAEAASKNLAAAIARGVLSDEIEESNRAANVRIRDLRAALDRLRQAGRRPAPVLPPVAEVRRLVREELAEAGPGDGVDAFVRRLVGGIVARPVRLAGSDFVRLRADLELDLSPLVPDAAAASPAAAGLLRRRVTVDLFDRPQRAEHAAEVGRLRAEGMGFREIAARVGITFPAAQNALKVFGAMRAAGSDDPYLPVEAPPDFGRYRRHLHGRYVFSRVGGDPA